MATITHAQAQSAIRSTILRGAKLRVVLDVMLPPAVDGGKAQKLSVAVPVDQDNLDSAPSDVAAALATLFAAGTTPVRLSMPRGGATLDGVALRIGSTPDASAVAALLCYLRPVELRAPESVSDADLLALLTDKCGLALGTLPENMRHEPLHKPLYRVLPVDGTDTLQISTSADGGATWAAHGEPADSTTVEKARKKLAKAGYVASVDGAIAGAA